MDRDDQRRTAICSMGTYILDDREWIGNINLLNLLTMRCYGCGAELPEGSKYCLSCGKRVGDKGDASSQNMEGVAEHVKTKREGKPIKLPLVFDAIIGVSALLLLIMLYFAFR